jgi:hypothetical protein
MMATIGTGPLSPLLAYRIASQPSNFRAVTGETDATGTGCAVGAFSWKTDRGLHFDYGFILR